MNTSCVYEYAGVELDGLTDQRIGDHVLVIFFVFVAALAGAIWRGSITENYELAFVAVFSLAAGVIYVSNLCKPCTRTKRIRIDCEGVSIWFFRSERTGSKWEKYSIQIDWTDVSSIQEVDCGSESYDWNIKLNLKKPCAAGETFLIPAIDFATAKTFSDEALALRPL
jgi:hypothetical protein